MPDRASASSAPARVGDELAVEAELMCTMRDVSRDGSALRDTRIAAIHRTAIVDPRLRSPTRCNPDRGEMPLLIGPPGHDPRRGHQRRPRCVGRGRTTVGRDNRICQFCSLGGMPPGPKYARRKPTQLHIGDPQHDPRVLAAFNIGAAQRRRRDPDPATTAGCMANVHRARRPGRQPDRARQLRRTLAGHVHPRRLGHRRRRTVRRPPVRQGGGTRLIGTRATSRRTCRRT